MPGCGGRDARCRVGGAYQYFDGGTETSKYPCGQTCGKLTTVGPCRQKAVWSHGKGTESTTRRGHLSKSATAVDGIPITLQHANAGRLQPNNLIDRISRTNDKQLAGITPSSLAQDVTIASPTKDSSVTPGQKLKIVLQFQGTTSSVNHIAFSTGFKTTSKKDPTSLGRPYVGSVFPSPQSTDVVLDASKGTYTYEIDVPAAKDFLDGFSAPYELTVSDTYLLGATFTPILKLTSVTVNVQNNNS
ncbi:hypothetical protein PCANC_02447 [Puccinia coronata f. sp. avenae]|uniref:Uncharacterized protein n=1 Tax=Puccinia coronata f. sp. avenae TaxID=200324 RepID=A0A2N5W508_9BASI|nr:hypothetical protein PCANC_02447 [Puccinia coronata f. sp. avenae]